MAVASSKALLDLIQQMSSSEMSDLFSTESLMKLAGTGRSDQTSWLVAPRPAVESYSDPLFPDLSVLVHEKVVSHGPDYPPDANGTAVRVWKVTVNGEELQRPFYDRAIVSMAAKRLFSKIRARFLDDLPNDFGAF